MDFNMKKTLCSALISTLFLFSPGVSASVNITSKEEKDYKEIKSAKIVYSGDITAIKVSQLMASINDININAPQVKEIALYINSGGGSMDAGYMGAEAVKGSGIPIRTINAAMTGSSATLIYCAAEKRTLLPSATFYFHSASIGNQGLDEITPNHLAYLSRNINNANQIFRDAYKDCLKLPNSELDKILYSNDHDLLLRSAEAINKGLAQGVEKGIPPTDISYYITDETDKN